MDTHSFSFDGGDLLNKMGASWFVSYAYAQTVDPTHRNWARVSTAASRISKYNRTADYHAAWLRAVLSMAPDNLNRNTLGLRGEEIQAMARAVLEARTK